MERRASAMALCSLATLLASASAMHVGIQRVGELTPRRTEFFSSSLGGKKEVVAAAKDEEEGTVSMAWNPSPIHVLAGEPVVASEDVASAETVMHRQHHMHIASSSTEKCLSHELFQVLSEGMVVVGNIKETAESVNSPTYKGDQMSKILTLSIGLVLSVLLLFFGTKLATAAIAMVLFVVSFFLTFGVMDSMFYKPDVAPNFNMCVMPWVAAVIIGMLAAILILCCASKLAELSLFVLGFGLGAVGMYLARSFIVASVPELLITTHGFSYYWIILVVVALLCGLLATWLKTGVFVVSTIGIGAYGVATCVAGLVMTSNGGKPMGYQPGDISKAHFGPFLAIFISAAVLGAGVQYYFHTQDEKKKKEEDKAKLKKEDEEKVPE